jgi:hypothetical protein
VNRKVGQEALSFFPVVGIFIFRKNIDDRFRNKVNFRPEIGLFPDILGGTAQSVDQK